MSKNCKTLIRAHLNPLKHYRMQTSVLTSPLGNKKHKPTSTIGRINQTFNLKRAKDKIKLRLRASKNQRDSKV